MSWIEHLHTFIKWTKQLAAAIWSISTC